MSGPSYTTRLIDEWLRELFDALPAPLITGPRAAGKTTTAQRLAATVVRLDRQAEAEPFRDDPDAALRSLPEPVLLDEWQAVPQVLGAVKRAVDQGSGAGRFLVTGSVHGRLDAPTWPGTGRLVHLKMWGLTAREIIGSAPQPVLPTDSLPRRSNRVSHASRRPGSTRLRRACASRRLSRTGSAPARRCTRTLAGELSQRALHPRCGESRRPPRPRAAATLLQGAGHQQRRHGGREDRLRTGLNQALAGRGLWRVADQHVRLEP